jgi:hypothetical protein
MSCAEAEPVSSPLTINPSPSSWGAWIAGIWFAGVLILIVMLNRQGCGPDPRLTDISVAANGWTLRHWLPVKHPLCAIIAEKLIARGPLAGVRDEIYLVGNDPVLADRLHRAGWSVAAGDFAAEPRVDILSPEQTLKWSAGFRAEDFETAGGVMMDTAVLMRVVDGQYVAPHVPVGCAPPVSPGV